MSSGQITRQGIIDALAARDHFPWEVIEGCLSDPDECVPIFLLLLEREARGLEISPSEGRACFFATHLLAALRVTDALAPLTAILCNSPDRANLLFGDAIGDSIPMALMGLCAGKADAIWDRVAAPGADWVVREAYLRAWTHEALQERVPPDLMIERLRGFPSKIAPEPDSYLWAAWMTAIADLGLSELKPLVESLFQTGHIARDPFGYLPVDQAAFSEDLAEAALLRQQGTITLASWAQQKGYRPFAPKETDFRHAARHIMALGHSTRQQHPYPAPLLRVAEPDEDFTP
ncbi:DUF1186 domain-containing protein [Roseibium sp. CAU 1637]|uniref:DUF1186 domain-containing protein n=1 Tax=Roseibium limicola TaxID=2816037 RepID=A0A939ENG8_9HYPH|nr:DUF1186 domain-containing protein [Roseibium limicola]MBO0345657.1 DUF1186 domain-containing protein [Roseibium limicola]